MKEKIEKYIYDIVEKAFYKVHGNVEKSITWSLFSYIGIDRLKDIIEKIEKSTDHEVQNNKYTCLAELYSFTIKNNLENQQSDLLSKYIDFLPRLDQFKNGLKDFILKL